MAEYTYELTVIVKKAPVRIKVEINTRHVVLSIVWGRESRCFSLGVSSNHSGYHIGLHALPSARSSFEIVRPPLAPEWELVAMSVIVAMRQSFRFGDVQLDTSATGLDASCFGLAASFPPAVADALWFVASIARREAGSIPVARPDKLREIGTEHGNQVQRAAELKYDEMDIRYVCACRGNGFAEIRVVSARASVFCEIGNFASAQPYGHEQPPAPAAENLRNLGDPVLT